MLSHSFSIDITDFRLTDSLSTINRKATRINGLPTMELKRTTQALDPTLHRPALPIGSLDQSHRSNLHC